jgi:hypothetical protein
MDISRVALLVGSWHRRDRGVILSVADNPQATGLTRAAHTRGGHGSVREELAQTTAMMPRHRSVRALI